MARPTTCERILDSAEELFAEHGISDTSLRALTRHAQVNLAAVHYHFGSKEALLDAVVERHATPINAARRDALRRLTAPDTHAPDAHSILSAFFLPVIERMDMLERAGRPTAIARLLARIEAQPPAEVERLAQRHFGAIGSCYVAALAHALPHLEPDLVAERFRLANAVLGAVFSGNFVLDTLPGLEVRPRSIALQARDAIAFAIAGLCAPPHHSASKEHSISEPDFGPNCVTLEDAPR